MPEQTAAASTAPASVPPELDTTVPSEPEPVATTAEPTSEPPSASVAAQPAASYSLHLQASDLDSEIAKRKARAERFGLSDTSNAQPSEPSSVGAPTTAQDDEAARALARAQRFGTGSMAMGKLDEALPTESERGSRRRGGGRNNKVSNEAVSTGAPPDILDDPGLKKGFARRLNRANGAAPAKGGNDRNEGSGARNRSQSGRRTGEKPTGVSKPSGGGFFSSEKDRAAAEARKKRFTEMAS